MARFRLMTGRYAQGGKTYEPGDVVESDTKLDKRFVNKFEKMSYSKKDDTSEKDSDDEDEDDAARRARHRAKDRKKRKEKGEKSSKSSKRKNRKKSDE